MPTDNVAQMGPAEALVDSPPTSTQSAPARASARPRARWLIYAIVSALEGAFLPARGQRPPEPLFAAGRAMAAVVASLPLHTVERE